MDQEETKRVYPGAPEDKRDNDANQGGKRVNRSIFALAAVSALLLICSLSYFVFNPGALGQIPGFQDALQTTADFANDGDAASDDANAPDGNSASDDSSNEGDADNRDDASGNSSASGASDSSSKDLDEGGASSGSVSSGGAQDGSSSDGSQQSQAPQTITVRVIVDSSSVGGGVSADTTVTFPDAATPYDALCATGLSVNASSSGFGVYVSAIGGLAEFDHGGESGWKYMVNGSYPGQSSSSYLLSDGDVVTWIYATAL